MRNNVCFIALMISLNVYGQKQKHNQIQNINTVNKMDISIIPNHHVKTAIEALQANDKQAWFACFAENVIFTDDGRTMNFKTFFDNAFDKKEKFLEIDSIQNEGKDIYGKFYAGQWGTFRVYFKFHPSTNGKFTRLDIGQAPK